MFRDGGKKHLARSGRRSTADMTPVQPSAVQRGSRARPDDARERLTTGKSFISSTSSQECMFFNLFFVVYHICIVQCIDLDFRSMPYIKIDIIIIIINPFVLLNLEPKCAPGDPILYPESIFPYSH